VDPSLAAVRFGVLGYSTYNLGDDIQSLAARRLLPRVDFVVDREKLDSFEANLEGEHRLLLNGWFMHNPDRWPPAASLTPLPISMHLTADAISDNTRTPNPLHQSPAAALLSPPNARYLAQFGPVGARDLYTLRLLEQAKVDTYFSGCLTLTLPERDPGAVEDVVYLVDLDDELIDACRKRTRSEVRLVTHLCMRPREHDRALLAQSLLDGYARAKCVVTSRLHAAMPCLGMGVPVLLVDTQSDQTRFDGLHTLVRHASRAQVLRGEVDFDLEYPPDNRSDHLRYRHLLLEKVAEFVARAPGSPRAAPDAIDPRQASAEALWLECAAREEQLALMRSMFREAERAREELGAEIERVARERSQLAEQRGQASAECARLQREHQALAREAQRLRDERDYLAAQQGRLAHLAVDKLLATVERYPAAQQTLHRWAQLARGAAAGGTLESVERLLSALLPGAAGRRR